MHAEQLIKIYRETLSDIQWEGKTKPERIDQYKHVWPDEAEFIANLEEKPSAELVPTFTEHWLTKLKKHLLERNLDLSAESKRALIVPIESSEQYTGGRKLDDSTPLILIDSGLMKFIWVMNKAYIYGTDEGEFSKNYLTCMTLLFYALYLKKPETLKEELAESKFVTPPTPPHSDKSLVTILTAETMIHETFVLAHEIAHIELGHLTEVQGDRRSAFPPHAVSPLTTEFVSDVTTIESELAADNLAVELCMRAFGGDDKDIAQAVLTSIYQVSRYFLWLELVLQPSNDKQDLPWAARHFQLRQKIREMYKWGKPIFIVEHLDWLEDNMESGAFRAVALYEALWNRKESPESANN